MQKSVTVGVEMLNADGLTDINKIMVAFRSFANTTGSHLPWRTTDDTERALGIQRDNL